MLDTGKQPAVCFLVTSYLIFLWKIIIITFSLKIRILFTKACGLPRWCAHTHTPTADLQIQQIQKSIDYISGGSGHTGVSDDYEATCSFTDEL